MPKPVQSLPAGTFVCDACGARSFFEMLMLDVEQLPPETLAALKAEAGIPPGGGGFYFAMPTTVFCSGCKTEYVPFENPDELLDILENGP